MVLKNIKNSDTKGNKPYKFCIVLLLFLTTDQNNFRNKILFLFRQTDSLRRLAQSRDVTPMLVQTTPHVPGQPPPPSWPPRGSSYTPVPLSPSDSLAQFGTIDSGRAALNRPEYESFLQRPAPPPYSSCTRLPQELDDQGT